ncbi:MAG: DUF4476 domain-containing protein [Crocinitomicaceae bacterium]|nr:DUF4476 domain-containing protein [Crocinitomicaceae bacterium]MDG1346913.1 DUF4476 domain-containing protein [Crocinitomicaceae bacterium]
MRKMIPTLVAMFALMTSQAGELYVKINTTPGSYYATFENQAVYNNSGVFRFFELTGGHSNLLVRHQVSQQIMANVYISVPYNRRVIGEINAYGQFVLIESQPLNYISWYAQQNPFVVQNHPGICPPMTHPIGMMSYQQLSEADYQAFLKHVEDEVFDSGKLATAQNFVKKTRMSAEQIKGIADEFTFDESRLKWAKFAYDYCYNPANYYKLDDSFTFWSNRNALKAYVANK